MGGMVGHVARGECRRPAREAGAMQHRRPDRIAGPVERPDRGGAERRDGGDRVRRARALVHAGVPAAADADARAIFDRMRETLLAALARRLRRVLRGGPRHGPARDDRAHRCADPGDRRHARRGDAAGGRAVHRRADPRRAVRRARRRAYFQRRGRGPLHRGGAATSSPIKERRTRGRQGTVRGRHAGPAGGARRRARRPDAQEQERRSTRSSRTSSPATPGARSGPARACRGTPAAC